MWKSIWARVLSETFGDGLGADLAGRGSVFLVDEVRKSLDREDERITSVRLRPGESYSVLVRPPASPAERKLARAQRRLDERDRHLSRPSRGQLRAAQRLEKAQRRLDRRRPGSARRRRAEVREAELGARFDRVMRPTRRHLAVRRDLLDVTTRLDGSRAANLEKAQRGRRRRPPRERGHVYE